MKTSKSFFEAAQDTWPEDEAAQTAEQYRNMPENGWTPDEQAALHAKNVAHMHRVFSSEQDSADLIARYSAELVRLGCPAT